MQVERVQRWVTSALLLTVCALFATGMAILSGTVDRAGARPGLLVISCVVGLMAMAGVRVINQQVGPDAVAAARPSCPRPSSVRTTGSPADRLSPWTRCGSVVVHRRTAQGRAARPPRRVGLARDRLRARDAPPRASSRSTPTSCAASSSSATSPTSSRSTSRSSTLIRTEDDVRYLTYEVARELADEPAGPVRRADLHAVHLGAARRPRPRHADRGLHRGHRGRPDRRRARLRDRAALDLRHPRRERDAGRRRDPVVRDSTTASTRWSASGSAVPRSGVPRAQFKPHFDARPAGRACTACRTPARRPARRRSGTRCACSAPSGSATAPRPRRTRKLLDLPRRAAASRSRCARRPTSRPGPWRAWTSTRSGRSATPA